MKKIAVLGIFMLVCSFAMAQEKKAENDPTYSVSNYKHWNKAEYARKYNLDKLSLLQTSIVQVNENYKQPHNTVPAEKVVVGSGKVDRSTKSYKHPNGL